MASQVNLADTIDAIRTAGSKDKSSHLEDLKHVLRYNLENRSLQPLEDSAFQRIFESLLHAISTDRKAYENAKTSTVRKSTATRLSTSASTLRYVIGVGLNIIKQKTVRLLVEHIIINLAPDDEDHCEPLALDHAKSLKLLMSYPPHAEHLNHELWQQLTHLCITNIQNGQNNSEDANGGADTQQNHRSFPQLPSTSRQYRDLKVQVSEELVATLRSLTAVANVDISTDAASILLTALRFVKSDVSAPGVREDAFKLINNIVAWACTENVRMLNTSLSDILHMVRKHWSLRLPGLKDELLILLVQLEPFLTAQLQKGDSATILDQVKALYNVVWADYVKKQDRDRLQLNDIRLCLLHNGGVESAYIGNASFSLRTARRQAEHNWGLLELLARWTIQITGTNGATIESQSEEELDSGRSRKRVRLETPFDNIISTLQDGTSTAKIVALQVAVFIGENHHITPRQQQDLLQDLARCCADEDASTASWAFIASAGLAKQHEKGLIQTIDNVNSIWQMANRSMSNITICRAACHYLQVIHQSKLLASQTLSDLIQQLASSLDLNGPGMLCDSSLQLLEQAIRVSRARYATLSDALTQRIIIWLTRRWTPSKFDMKTHASTLDSFELKDLLSVLACTLCQPLPAVNDAAVPEWGAIGVAMIQSAKRRPITDYLISPDTLMEPCNSVKPAHRAESENHKTSQSFDSTIQTTILDHFIEELSRASEIFKEAFGHSSSSLTPEAAKLFSSTCYLAVIVSHDFTFENGRRAEHLQRLSIAFSQQIETCASAKDCSQDSIDAILRMAIQLLCKRSQSGKLHLPIGLAGAAAIASSVSRFLSRRSQYSTSMDDVHDLTARYESQDSRKSSQAPDFNFFDTSVSGSSSTLVLRCTASLYSVVLAYLNGREIDSENAIGLSKRIAEHIRLCPPPSAATMLRSVAHDLTSFIDMTLDDIEDMFDNASEQFFAAYTYNRSELALTSTVDFMVKTAAHWIDPENRSLSNLGLDMYEWLMKVTIGAKSLPPAVQESVIDLLLAICRHDPVYGSQTPDSPSARTSLFSLLRHGPISVQFYLASRLPSIFELYAVSTHDQIFHDLQSSLPVETTWLEGIAVRLYILAELGSAWHSLLRPCVYYIFETAGRVPMATPYAKQCIVKLTTSLTLGSPARVFTLFGPQLLYTWLEDHDLQALPFEIFGYASLEELILQNKDEIVAQLFLRHRDQELEHVAAQMQQSIANLLSQAFDRVFAYAMSWDVTSVAPDSHTGSCEIRLRDAIGGKDKIKRLIRNNRGAIIGRILLATYREDNDEKWLTKRQSYSQAAKAMANMKDYSQSTQCLASSQQPHFKSKYLLDQLERLARRLGYTTSAQIWTPSSFTLASQMLFDSADKALGPMYSCAVFQTLRIMIALAEQVPLRGYTLENVLRLLLPYLNNDACAHDVIGILHYLLSNSLPYLCEDWVCLWGVALHIVLRLSAFDRDTQQTHTQTSQQREILMRMQRLRAWLLTYLENVKTSLPDHLRKDGEALLHALQKCSLPGNAIADSAESSLLLFLLEQKAAHGRLLSQEDTQAAIMMLAQDFALPRAAHEDCLGDIAKAKQYAQQLWQISNMNDVGDNFKLWSSLVVGRAFTSTGSSKFFEVPTEPEQGQPNQDSLPRGERSRTRIARHLMQMLYSGQTHTVSIALSTVRACMRQLGDASETVTFQKLFPEALIDAIDTSSEYHKLPAVDSPKSKQGDNKSLQHAFAVEESCSLSCWTARAARSICALPVKTSFLGGLSLLLTDQETSARRLLPAIVHLTLIDQGSEALRLRDALSASMQAHFKSHDERLVETQRTLVELLLYLFSEPYPGESTLVDRAKWVDCDLMGAADVASRCEMPTTALMLAEMARTDNPASKRSRSSSFPRLNLSIPDTLLLSIFQQISEPDSYYGVTQAASLETYLKRSQYEGNAMQALVAKSAQLGSQLRSSHGMQAIDKSEMMQSLSSLSLDSLTLALAQAGGVDASASTGVMLDSARLLQQWDLSMPEQQETHGSALYRAFSLLNRATDPATYVRSLQDLILVHRNQLTDSARPSLKWTSALSSLTEIMEAITNPKVLEDIRLCDLSNNSNTWMELGSFDGLQTLVTSRCTMAGVLRDNKSMQEALHLSPAAVKLYETKALVMLSQVARTHGRTELAVSASWRLNDLASDESQIGLVSIAKRETASVLWQVKESTASIQMLRDLASNSDGQDDGYPGLLSQIGQQLADARMEKPGDILQNYLRPSIEQLKSKAGLESGQVFHTFASFCDAQVQSTSALADFQRVAKLRQAKLEEVQQLQALLSASTESGAEKKQQSRTLDRAKQWFKIDDEEYQKAKQNRDLFAEQALKNYIQTLRASDKHDLCVLRLFALWLEHSDIDSIQATASKGLPEVPTWKFVLLMNQLISRLKGDQSTFDKTLQRLLLVVCRDHPYHTVHHLYAARKFPGKEEANQLRRDAAERLCRDLIRDKSKGEIIGRMLKADSLYRMLAEEPNDSKHSGKFPLQDSQTASKVARHIPKERVPPATLELALRPDGNYEDVPTVTSLANTVTIMTGLSAPKVLTMYASNGLHYKQLFKSGNDDLRQDAIMEQVFSEVSKMLRNDKASRQRDLHVRTYKVVPLTNRCGIIEFVPNSIPINDFLQPAHQKYHPTSLKTSVARLKISNVADHSVETRVKEYRKVCDQMPPVMRYFFFERFKEPDEWFEKRTAYTRTTATISMLGQILGLGDRHCHNILLDEQNGEVIHIDLGVAFEAGRVLPIPELVPFRLTRDIIDGMGVTGVEGIFRRCAEFTLDALRKDKNGIMTLLNVLRYDPLYSWTLSPVRAKRMQQQQQQQQQDGEISMQAGVDISGKKSAGEAGEAERALSVVEKKLGDALSTAASVNELIQQATDERHLATLFNGWAAFF